MIDLYNMDCMEYMKGVADNAYDICITSPPYNMNLRVNSKGDGYCSRQVISKEFASKYTGFDDNLPMAEYEQFLSRAMREILRVSGIVFFNIQMITGNKPALFRFMGEFADQIKELVIWDKCKAQPAMLPGVLNSEYELVIILGDKPITRAFQSPLFDRGTLSNVWRLPSKKSGVAGHKASFPVSLVEKIIRNFGNDGGVVFDPFAGTGTTAIAAHNCGLDFVGCELDAGYYDAAKARIDSETSQIAMF